MSPPAIPRDISGILRENQRRWQQVTKIYSETVLPELLQNKKWFENKNDDIEEGSKVLFKKREANNFVPGWTYGNVKQLITGQ